MKKQNLRLTLTKTSIRRLTSHELGRVGGGIFDQEQQQTTLTLIGVSGDPPKQSDTCSWGCSHTCSNYATCA